MSANPRVYDIRARRPNKNHAGSIIASMRAYVGLHELNTGHRANPMNTYFIVPSLAQLLWSILFELLDHHSLVDIVFHTFGKIVIIPRAIIIPPEKDFQKLGGTPMRTVLAFKRRENKIIDTESDPIMIRGILLLFPSSALAPRTIGSSGNTHGARTVRTPERNAITNRVI